MIRKILKTIDTISKWTGTVSAFFIPAMMFIITYEVVARYVFGAPTIWAMESSQYLFLATTALGGAYLLLYRRHINVSLLSDKMGKKARAVTEIVTSLFFFIFIVFLFYHTLETTIEAVGGLQNSPTYWGPPIYPVYLVMTLGILLILVQGIVQVTKNIIMLIRGEYDLFDQDLLKEGQHK